MVSWGIFYARRDLIVQPWTSNLGTDWKIWCSELIPFHVDFEFQGRFSWSRSFGGLAFILRIFLVYFPQLFSFLTVVLASDLKNAYRICNCLLFLVFYQVWVSFWWMKLHTQIQPWFYPQNSAVFPRKPILPWAQISSCYRFGTVRTWYSPNSAGSRAETDCCSTDKPVAAHAGWSRVVSCTAYGFWTWYLRWITMCSLFLSIAAATALSVGPCTLWKMDLEPSWWSHGSRACWCWIFGRIPKPCFLSGYRKSSCGNPGAWCRSVRKCWGVFLRIFWLKNLFLAPYNSWAALEPIWRPKHS